MSGLEYAIAAVLLSWASFLLGLLQRRPERSSGLGTRPMERTRALDAGDAGQGRS